MNFAHPNQAALVYSDLNRLNDWRFHVKQLKIGNRQAILSQSSGATKAIRKGRGMDFSEVRPYQAGDEVRHIDWKVTARTQKTHTKLFTEEHERPVIFLVEQSGRLFFGSQYKFKSVLALDVLSALAWAALNQGDKVGGLIVGQTQWIEPKRQDRYLQQLLNVALKQNLQLSQPESSHHQAWLNALKQVTPLIHPNSKLVLIGDLFSLSNAQNQLQTLAKHTDILAIHLVDPLDYQLPKQGLLSISNGEQNINLDTQSPKLQNQYQQAYQQAWSQLEQQMQQAQIALVTIETQDDLIQTLVNKRVLRR